MKQQLQNGLYVPRALDDNQKAKTLHTGGRLYTPIGVDPRFLDVTDFDFTDVTQRYSLVYSDFKDAQEASRVLFGSGHQE